MSGSENHSKDVGGRVMVWTAQWQRLRAWWCAEDRNRVIWTAGGALLTFLIWAAF